MHYMTTIIIIGDFIGAWGKWDPHQFGLHQHTEAKQDGCHFADNTDFNIQRCKATLLCKYICIVLESEVYCT